MNERFLDGKIAVITGANRGLGRAIALALGGAGASIALVARDEEKLLETKKMLTDLAVASEIYLADISQESRVIELETEIKERQGMVHILVNNAGTAIRKNVSEFTLSEWQSVIDTNLTGAFLMSRSFISHMQKNGWGRIINMTSIMANVGSAGRGAYCASKSGLLALTKCLALELVDSNINVTAISPGFYSTDLTAPLRANKDANRQLMDATPAGRWGDPAEVGNIALFLCSDGANFMTGNDILTDGGWVAQ